MHMPPATNMIIAGDKIIAAADTPTPPVRKTFTEILEGRNRDDKDVTYKIRVHIACFHL